MLGASVFSVKHVAVKLGFLCLVVLSLPGCALFAPKAPGVDHHYTGFLQEYRSFNTSEVEEADFVSMKFWATQGVSLNQYSAVHVEPVEIVWGVQRDKQVTRQALHSLQDYLQNRLTASFNQPLKQLPSVGFERKLVVKAAITGLETKDERYQIYEMLPAGIALTTLSKLIGIRDEEVNLHLEVAFVDELSGQVVAKSLVGIVGSERLENRWEEITLDKLRHSIDEWTTLQTVAFRQLPGSNLIADTQITDHFIAEQDLN